MSMKLPLSIMAAVLIVPVTAEDNPLNLPIGVNWRVRLLAPLSTAFNRRGDMVSARVTEPSAFLGAILEGLISDVKDAANQGRSATVQFEFVRLHHGDHTTPITALLIESINTRGDHGADDSGAALEFAGAAIGPKLVGRLLRSDTRSVRLTAKCQHLWFAPGSEFVLQMKLGKLR